MYLCEVLMRVFLGGMRITPIPRAGVKQKNNNTNNNKRNTHHLFFSRSNLNWTLIDLVLRN